MLSWPTISRHPEWFSCWINAAGCLLKGSNLFLDEFSNGYWYNKSPLHMISKEAFFTFPGLYTYFPIPGEEFGGEGTSDYVASDGTFFSTKDMDMHNVSTWEKFKLGVFAWKKQATQEERDHLKHCLDTAKRFRQKNLLKKGDVNAASFLDNHPSAYDHLKIICYGSDKLPTHSAFEVNMEEKSIGTSKSKLTTPGDGTLFATNWQLIPGGLKREIIMAEEGSNHVTLVNDRKLQGVLLDAFFSGDELKKASAKSLLK
mmetsp:Transcript_2159/g.3206  ORF Transcript_2159/g.3206 Transcript_2159/m.3206 type:complete len:258 (-) Transcript_2159:1142-1915(-)